VSRGGFESEQVQGEPAAGSALRGKESSRSPGKGTMRRTGERLQEARKLCSGESVPS
jgi:hypothetical protein